MSNKKNPQTIKFTLPIVMLMVIIGGVWLNKLIQKTSFATSDDKEKLVEHYQEQQMMEEKGIIRVGNRYLQYGVKEQGGIKPITDMLEGECRDDHCKIERYYTYVKRLPYEAGTKNKDKNALDVILNGKGDCDERSYLFASMLFQNHYESVIIYTQDHAFVGVHIPNYDTTEPRCYLLIKGKKYYYAETTDINGYLGSYNGVDPQKYVLIYDVNAKKEIPLGEVKAMIYH